MKTGIFHKLRKEAKNSDRIHCFRFFLLHNQNEFLCLLSVSKGSEKSYLLTETQYFICFWLKVFLVFDRAKSQTAAAFNFQMTVKVLYAAYDPFTFLHPGTCSQCNGIALLSSAQTAVRLMCVAPGGASVNKSLELTGDISPV